MKVISITAALLLLITVVLSQAAGPAAKPSGSGKKKLLFFAKDPATWSIIKSGGTGKLVYRESSGDFNLTASGLEPRSAYALIRYADTPPKGEILARGVSDGQGKLVLTGTWRNWTHKFWLVAGEDVSGSPGEAGAMKVWRPQRYLFEEKPLGIACNCPEPEEP
jgi:hypothetical protein